MSDKKTSIFSAREIEVLAAAMRCTEGPIKVNTAKLAAELNLVEGSARNAWGAIRKKLEAANSSSPTTANTPKSTSKAIPKSTSTKGTKVQTQLSYGLGPADDDDEVDTIAVKTPSKKGKRAAGSDDDADDEKPKGKRGRPAKKRVVVEAAEGGNEDDGEEGGPVGDVDEEAARFQDGMEV